MEQRTPNFFDTMVREIMIGMDTGQRDLGAARSMAGELEDEKLRGALGSSRKMRKGEKLPSGSYSLARYPGIDHDVWAMERGFLPWHGTQESGKQRDVREEQQRIWAMRQKQMLDTIPGPWGYRG